MVLSVHARWFPVALAGALFALVCGPVAVEAEEKIASPAEARLKNDVSFLADDARDGRAPGTNGIEAAADYIAAAFKDAGLKPAQGAQGYFQPFTISGIPVLKETTELVMSGPDGKEVRAAANLSHEYEPPAQAVGEAK